MLKLLKEVIMQGKYNAFVKKVNKFLNSNKMIELNITDWQSLKRMYLKIVTDKKNINNYRELLLAVGFEMNESNFKIIETEIIEVCRGIMKSLNIRQNDIHIIFEELDKLRITDTLINKKKLREEYFKTYSAERNSEMIMIKMPNKGGYIGNDSQVVNVNVDIKNGFELGFFRKNYDYHFVESGERLQTAFITKNGFRESCETMSNSYGTINLKNIIWAR